MKKKEQETEIATNMSSGAEKVEIIEKENKKTRSSSASKPRTTQTKSVKTVVSAEKKSPEEMGIENVTLGTAKKNTATEKSTKTKTERVSAKKINSESSGSRAEKESQAAKERVEAALKKKEAQAKRKEERKLKAAKKAEARAKKAAEKKALIEKRAAERKALAEKRAAARKEKAEKRAAAKKALVEKRANAKKAKKQTSNKKKEGATHTRNKKEKNRERRKENGYGGWIAAVVSLGVVTLALATTVTVGAIEMKNATDTMMMAHRSTMYELTGLMEHVDDDLDRIRVSNSPAQQTRILTDLLVQARLAEQDVEKLPISAEEDRNITTFINRTAMESERMLSKLRNGGKLTAEDRAVLEKLYSTNHTIRMELDKLTSTLSDKDMTAYIKEKKGSFFDALQRIEKSTIEENRAAFEHDIEETEGAGTKRNTPATPHEKQESHIDPARAEELCKSYFPTYKIDEYQCVGETVARSYAAYNVQGYDDKGTMLFAEISQKDGTLLRFDYYEDCMGENFNLDNAEQIAQQFLDALGYEDLEIVRLRENGTTADFTFVYESDGVVYYPDEIRVKVCRTRGVVTGLDATDYIRNHKEREEVKVGITLAEAYEKLHKALEVESSQLAVVSTQRGERSAYEFLCSYGEERYFVYLDAVTGEEIAIVNSRNLQA